MRGGVSYSSSTYRGGIRSSPHAWGCFFYRAFFVGGVLVFPTCVGVFPRRPTGLKWRHGLPHMRGGVSQARRDKIRRQQSSPHAWGCFPVTPPFPIPVRVFPTCVGVFLPVAAVIPSINRLPHMRGGVSSKNCQHGWMRRSSPHAWGCFYPAAPSRPRCPVFPTCVGVFPASGQGVTLSRGLPHMRGGVSIARRNPHFPGQSSPHAWGCFQ